MKETYVRSSKEIKKNHAVITAINEAQDLDGFKRAIEGVNLKAIINDYLVCGARWDANQSAYYQQLELPLFHAVTAKKPFLVPYLTEMGAKEPDDRRLLSHALRYLNYLKDIKECIHDQGYVAFYPGDLAKSTSDEIFNFIHKAAFNNRSLLEVARSEDVASAENASYHNEITKADYRRKTKPIFLNKIQENHEIQAALKKQCLLGIENPIITFLKSSKKHNVIKETRSYKTLMKMLGEYHFQPIDFQQWRDQLLKNAGAEGFKPNPALAALYFSHVSPENDDDYRIFEKHLMITSSAGYMPEMQECLQRLLSRGGLSKVELTTLKKNILTILDFKKQDYSNQQGALKDNVASPLRSIARTIKFTRGDKATKTYHAIRGMGFFAPDFKPNALPAYDAQVYKPQ